MLCSYNSKGISANLEAKNDWQSEGISDWLKKAIFLKAVTETGVISISVRVMDTLCMFFFKKTPDRESDRKFDNNI